MTEIYDYLRVLYARVGMPHCPVSGEAVTPQSRERIIKVVQSYPEKTKLIILAPHARGKKGEFKEDLQTFCAKDTRAHVSTEILSNLVRRLLSMVTVAHDVDVVIDRLTVTPENQSPHRRSSH